VNEFQYVSYAQEVIFGPGSLDRLGKAVERFGWQRLMLCSSRSVHRLGIQDSLEAILGDRLVARFNEVQPHVQDFQLEEALSLSVERQVDAVVGLGGGSPLGMAKATASGHEAQLTGRPARAADPTDQPRIPVIAVPTTYAGSEMTAVYGITHTWEVPPRKVTFSDPKIAPKLVLYDPLLTLSLSPRLTASTGINALAHCLEALYSITRHPLSSAAATAGIRHIHHALLRCYTNGDDLESRTEMMLGAHLAGSSLASAAMGLHHGLCHVLGGTFAVPHGIANGIILPHAIRFNAAATVDFLLPAVEAMGINVHSRSPVAAVEALASRVFDLVSQLDLPQRLRDVGVNEQDLQAIARLAFENRTVRNNPRPVVDPGEIESLLREAW
jgi:maleylacetate reductase